MLCIFSFAAILTGCGGGGAGVAENRPPIATVGGLVVQGVVSVRVSAVAPRSASLEAESVVSDATVVFSVEGENIPLSQTRSDGQGRFVLPIRSGVRGRISVLKDNRQLSAILVPGNATGTIERNVNLESTVVEMALRNQNTLSYDVKAMEEAVRIGEAPALLDEVKNAFRTNRSPSPSTTAISEGLTKLVGAEASATQDCLAGQEWCVVISSIESTSTANTYLARVLLRRDRTDGNNSPTSQATIGAGHLTVRLPVGLTLASISGSAVTGANVIADNGNAETGNSFQVSFLYEANQGIGEAAKLADITITATRALTNDDRAIVVDQKLLGTLNEKRNGVAKVASGF